MEDASFRGSLPSGFITPLDLVLSNLLTNSIKRIVERK